MQSLARSASDSGDRRTAVLSTAENKSAPRAFSGTVRRSWTRSWMTVSLCVFVASYFVSSQEAAPRHSSSKVLRRLLAPLRSNPISQSSVNPCGLGMATCYSPAARAAPPVGPELSLETNDPYSYVMLELRTAHSGPFAHHWLELQTATEAMTIGFGPATLPFIDAGQVSLQDQFGNIKRVSGMHPLPWLALPPINYRYARNPGEGHIIGRSILLTNAQSDALIHKMQHLKFVGPYIPLFHDCRTFTCTVQAKAQGHSTLPCYLLFKGYW